MANPDPGLIDQYAAKYRLDPAAVKANALGEGGIHYGAVGDNGTSFGPFQLHIGGALPKKYAISQAAASAFANSPAGIEYALRKMAESGAAGLTGQPALASIVRNFEIPADIPGQIAKRSGYLDQFSHGQSPIWHPPTSDGTGGLGPLRPPVAQPAGLDQTAKQMLVAQLLSHNHDDGGGLGAGGLLQMAMARQQAQAAQDVFGPQPSNPGFRGGQAPSSLKDLPKPGNLDPGFFQGNVHGESPSFLKALTSAVAAAGGTQIRVNSGERSLSHNASVGGVQGSNHLPQSDGYSHAMDGSAYVPRLKRWVPLGTLLKGSAGKFGLRSGDVLGFYHGGTDPVHVDDGFNVRHRKGPKI